MKRYAAFLRGVMPSNCAMPDLVRAFEAAGFANAKTLLSSGNVSFDARARPEAALEHAAEAAIRATLGRDFMTFVRSIEHLRAILACDPYRGLRLGPDAKRVITFLREPPRPAPALPVDRDGACVWALEGRELFSAYLPCDKGPVFMTLIEKTIGREQTTRTWRTVERIAR
jgi:uncharacterized protein (DUF1697 family)